MISVFFGGFFTSGVVGSSDSSGGYTGSGILSALGFTDMSYSSWAFRFVGIEIRDGSVLYFCI